MRKHPEFQRVNLGPPKVQYAIVWKYYQSSITAPAEPLGFLWRCLFIVTETLANMMKHFLSHPARDIFDLYSALQVAPPPRLCAILQAALIINTVDTRYTAQ